MFKKQDGFCTHTGKVGMYIAPALFFSVNSQ